MSSPRDVVLLALMSLSNDTEFVPPEHGFQAAAERLYRQGFIVRDPTRTTRPYRYTITESGAAMVSALVNLVQQGLQ